MADLNEFYNSFVKAMKIYNSAVKENYGDNVSYIPTGIIQFYLMDNLRPLSKSSQ